MTGSEVRHRPRRHQILGVVVKPNTDAPEWNKRLEYTGSLHKCCVSKTAYRFEGKRLLPLADPDRSERASLFEVHPNIGKRRPPEEPKIHLQKVVHTVGDGPSRAQSSSSKIGSVFNPSVGIETPWILIEKNSVCLEHSVDLNTGKFSCICFGFLGTILKQLELLVHFGRLSFQFRETTFVRRRSFLGIRAGFRAGILVRETDITRLAGHGDDRLLRKGARGKEQACV